MSVVIFGYLALAAMAAIVHAQDQSGAHLSLSLSLSSHGCGV